MLKIKEKPNKIVVILGPTASGKSSAAIKLAQKFDGEIISCDSRQVYRGMDIGSGKVTKTEQAAVPHWMLDIISPRTNFGAAQFKKKADRIINDILKRGKVPILCGGTGFWIKAIVDNVSYPEVKPDWELRKQLNEKPIGTLFAQLKKMDPERAKNIDQKNKVRLIRAIEICQTLGKVPVSNNSSSSAKYDALQIGIKREKDTLQQRIRKNIKTRMSQGMIEEVKNLRSIGLSWKKIESFGLSYKLVPQYLRGEIQTEADLSEKIFLAEKDYAKRQMTWFQKDSRIIWLPVCRRGRENYQEIEKTVGNFLDK